MIFNEDCLDTMKRLKDKSVDLILTDPPYNVGIDYGDFDDKKNNFVEWMKPRFFEMERVAKTVIISTGHYRLPDYAEIRKWKWLLAWHKPAAMGRCPVGFSNWEPIAMWGKGHSNGVDLFRAMIKPDKSLEWHPVPKPIEWGQKIIAMFKDAKIVYDPFIGSGTVAIASEIENREWIGSEINPEYVENANKRIDIFLSQGNLFKRAGSERHKIQQTALFTKD